MEVVRTIPPIPQSYAGKYGSMALRHNFASKNQQNPSKIPLLLPHLAPAVAVAMAAVVAGATALL